MHNSAEKAWQPLFYLHRNVLVGVSWFGSAPEKEEGPLSGPGNEEIMDELLTLYHGLL